MRGRISSIKIHGDYGLYMYDNKGRFTYVQSPGLANLQDAGFDNMAVTFDVWGPKTPYAIFYSEHYSGDYRAIDKATKFSDIGFANRAGSIRVFGGRIGISGHSMSRSLSGNVRLGRLYNRVEYMNYIKSVNFD